MLEMLKHFHTFEENMILQIANPTDRFKNFKQVGKYTFNKLCFPFLDKLPEHLLNSKFH